MSLANSIAKARGVLRRSDIDEESDEEARAAGAKARLSNMQIREVSLVTSPANRRPFVITKIAKSLEDGELPPMRVIAIK